MRVQVSKLALYLLLLAGPLAVLRCFGQTQEVGDLLEHATAAQSSGDYAAAADFYARATALVPSQAELWSNRGVMEFLSGQIDSSIVSLKHALQLNPHLFTPKLFLGKAFIQNGKPTFALPYLHEAHVLHPTDVETLLTLGKANNDLKQPGEASTFYAEATKSAPQNAAAWFGLGVSSLDRINSEGQRLAATQGQSIWAQSLYADELFAQGKPLEATDKYDSALNNATPVQKANLAQTIAWMQSRPDLFPLPPNSQAALQRLSAKVEEGQEKSDVRPCPRAGVGETTPQSPSMKPSHEATNRTSTNLQEMACAFRQGDYELSAAQADKELRQSPDAAEALYWSIKANERIAVAALARFEELSSQSPANYVLVGNLYRFQRQADSALIEYRKALALDPHNLSALMGAALASLSADKLEDAASFDQEALADHPLDSQLNLLMAEVLDAENRYDNMETYLAKCVDAPVELQPRVHYLLGRVYAEQGKTGEAIHEYELAKSADKDGTTHYQLSRLYRKIGNQAEAEKALTEAKTLISRRDASASIVVREASAINP